MTNDDRKPEHEDVLRRIQVRRLDRVETTEVMKPCNGNSN